MVRHSKQITSVSSTELKMTDLLTLTLWLAGGMYLQSQLLWRPRQENGLSLRIKRPAQAHGKTPSLNKTENKKESLVQKSINKQETYHATRLRQINLQGDVTGTPNLGQTAGLKGQGADKGFLKI